MLAQGFVLSTKVVDTKGQGLQGVMVESTGAEASAFSDESGRVELKMTVPQAIVRISLSGYYSVELPVSESNQPAHVTLIPENWKNYTQGASLNKKDMAQAMNIDMPSRARSPAYRPYRKAECPPKAPI